MTTYTRRDLLGGIAGAVGVLSGCSENEAATSGTFTETRVEDQQLIVEFEESLETETISVIDPDGEAFAERSLTPGASRVSFDIGMPYTPGEYRIVVADDGETFAETTQVIRPDLEIIDVGVGANRMDEMPDELGHTKDEEAILQIQNSGSGPELITKLEFRGDLPNPTIPEGDQVGIFDPESRGDVYKPLKLKSGDQVKIFSSTMPFSFEGDGVECSTESMEGEAVIVIKTGVTEGVSEEYLVKYTSSDSYDGCGISLTGV